jgi:AAA+ ATPase superfamily predicted ATPase
MFFGRNTELQEIQSQLAEQWASGDLASLLIYGMAGIGKSEVALHFALEHMKDYDIILWFHAADIVSKRASATLRSN